MRPSAHPQSAARGGAAVLAVVIAIAGLAECGEDGGAGATPTPTPKTTTNAQSAAPTAETTTTTTAGSGGGYNCVRSVC